MTYMLNVYRKDDAGPEALPRRYRSLVTATRHHKRIARGKRLDAYVTDERGVVHWANFE